MNETLQYRYSHDLDSVVSALTDEQYNRARRTELGDSDIRFVNRSRGPNRETELSFTVDADLPAFAKKLFSKLVKVSVRGEWPPRRGEEQRATYRVEIAGGVAELRRHVVLRDAGGACEHSETFDIHVRFPLFKKRIAGHIAAETRKAVLSDCDHLERTLKQSAA